jgi:hypothetical protein
MKKAIVSTKETVQAPLGLKLIFVDKDFKYSWAMDFRASDIERYQKMDKEFFKRIFDQYLGNGITGILKLAPKNWKSYQKYEKVFIKVMTAKTKDNEKRVKQGKKLMSKKEWKKGIPVFQSKLSPDDIRIILVGKNCSARLFVLKNLTDKVFKKIIDTYKP